MKNAWVLLGILPSLAMAETSSDTDFHQVSKELTIITTDYGTNIGALKSQDALLLIDPMPGETSLKAFHQSLKTKFKSSQTYLVNTHGHSDHTGGNVYFINQGAHVLTEGLDRFGIEHKVVGSHTSRDSIYFHKPSNSIFVGDIFDTSWHPTFYFDGLKGLDASVDTILSMGDESSLIIPGHGKPANKSALREFRNNTHVWYSKVAYLYSKGKSVEQLLNNKELNQILSRFNINNADPFLPERAHRRFIERTIELIDNESS